MSELPNFPIAVLDELEAYTYSLEHALAITSVPRVSEDQLAARTAELGTKRTTLLSDIEALTNRGFIEPGSTVNARGAKRIRNIAFDVWLFAEILLGVLPAAEGKTGATREELIAAKELAMTALRALGERPITSVTPADVELRARAFTVFSRAYDRVRRAMVYIRADAGDVDELMPSLYQGRGGSHRKEQPDAGEQRRLERRASFGRHFAGRCPVEPHAGVERRRAERPGDERRFHPPAGHGSRARPRSSKVGGAPWQSSPWGALPRRCSPDGWRRRPRRRPRPDHHRAPHGVVVGIRQPQDRARHRPLRGGAPRRRSR